jgi:hypothetical protein
MDTVMQTIDSSLLNGIIPLPKRFQNKLVEVVVSLAEESVDLPPLTMSDIDEMLKGSITESLIGVLPDTGMSLEDYRAERLKKYERAD